MRGQACEGWQYHILPNSAVQILKVNDVRVQLPDRNPSIFFTPSKQSCAFQSLSYDDNLTSLCLAEIRRR